MTEDDRAFMLRIIKRKLLAARLGVSADAYDMALDEYYGDIEDAAMRRRDED